MKFSPAIIATVLSLAAFAAASPVPEEDVGVSPHLNILEARKGCSGERLESDVCGGKKLQAQHSFHNCKSSGGKCCALDANGDRGIDVNKGVGSEECGYCFSAKCKG